MFRLFAFLSFCLFATAAAATQTLYINAPRDGGLNLRSGPSTAYHILREMPHGSRVTLLRRPGTWVQLRHESGAVGWAHGRYLSTYRPAPIHAPAPAPSLETRYVHAPTYGALNLREGPGTGHPVILRMKQGAAVELLGKTGHWQLVRHSSGAVGWAHGRYLVAERRHHVPRLGPQHQRPRHWHPSRRSCKGLHGPAWQICRARQLADRSRYGW